MNTVLIFAGGTGQRMNSRAKPKQFLELHGKPIIIHTIELFERHPQIDQIVVVCLKEWIKELELQIKKNYICKVKLITEGGKTGHESIYLGLKAMRKLCGDDDIVLLHDGVRPLVTEELISENIETVKKFGNAITVAPATETISVVDEEENIVQIEKRDKIRVAKAPQSFLYRDIMEAYERARKEKVLTVDSAQLMNYYGYKLHTVTCSQYNMKITAPSDFYIYRALYEALENQQIFGI